MSSKTLQQIKAIKEQLKNTIIDKTQSLFTKQHIAYVNFVLKDFGEAVIHFDFSQPWLFYYAVHTLNLIGIDILKQDKQKIEQAIFYCENKEGYAGGYKQQPHLAPTYASFLTLISLGKEYLDRLNKENIYQFFKKVKKGGRFMMSEMGECDVRGSYIVVILTKMLNLKQDILEGVAESILSSQTPEGGISNIIGGEAHGGFTYCAIAALAAMKRLHELDISRLMFWLSRRQVQFGGFNGRTNKLIDSCYSFWIGSTFNIVNDYFDKKMLVEDNQQLYFQKDLQKYILLFCQDKTGGLKDKPGKMRDLYHTAYALSGLSLSQKKGGQGNINGFQLKENNPIYNVTQQKYKECLQELNLKMEKQNSNT